MIGIDLGTTNSVAAVIRGGQPMVIPNRSGSKVTPSVVAVALNGKRLVGAIAKRQAVINAPNTAFAIKRLIGRKYSSEVVQQSLRLLPYKLIAGAHDDIRIVLGEKAYSPSELSAMILAEMKANAQAFLNTPVNRAVITVPAYFNDNQRQATKVAGKIAGLEVLRIINEPTSAALAYGLGKKIEGTIAVFDLGGGTFDISILRVSDGIFEVIASGGDTFLGGEDFDNRIIERIAFRFGKEHGIDLRKDKMALQRLREAAEKAKCELSSVSETQISLPFIYTDNESQNALHLDFALNKEILEMISSDLVERCIDRCQKTLKEAKVRTTSIREVILVGGMTRMPAIIDAVKQFFGKEPCKGVHPQEVVALGAAIEGNTLVQESPNIILLDVTPHSLGVGVVGGYAHSLISKNTTIPASATEVFSTSCDYQTSVRIMVLQGESEIAAKNELLGEFVLSGLRPEVRGGVEIAVTFDIGVDGILSVSARDKLTGRKQSVTFTASGGLTQEELEKILDEQRDFLLEMQVVEELSKKRIVMNELAAELEATLARSREHLYLYAGQIEPGMIEKMEHQVHLASELAGKDLKAVINCSDELAIMLTTLRGILARLGKPV